MIALAAPSERRDPRSWVRLVLLDAASERIALAPPPSMPVPPPVVVPTPTFPKKEPPSHGSAAQCRERLTDLVVTIRSPLPDRAASSNEPDYAPSLG